jgi:AraC-like DNA-binding protein
MSDRPERVPAVDVLTDVLSSLEMRGWLHSRNEITPPWRFDFTPSPDSVFHILGAGGGYLLGHDAQAAPMRVGEGDVVVFPFGDAHTICDQPASGLTQSVSLDYDPSREHQVFSFAGDGPEGVMLCGAFRLDRQHHLPLLRSMPRLIHIPVAQGGGSPDFTQIVALIAAESGSPRPGSEALLRRLAEILFIQVIRAWVEQQSPQARGWLEALQDPSIGIALGLIHQTPQRSWSVEGLADAAALSRSAFSARFTRLVGEPPIRYVTRWRMHYASRLLRNGQTVPAIARHLGYDSEVAFRKAFKRELGIPPGRYRHFTDGN